ncbi:FtsX-like permease family protein [Massilia sp. W12]|uniref:ABC transporter permease n=1 Tax=Massilia sp. W12 TaxID=3126507 RepID=UPI0030CF5968
MQNQTAIGQGLFSNSRWKLVLRSVLRQRSRNLMLGLLIFTSSLAIVYFSQFLQGVQHNFTQNLVSLASGNIYVSSKITRDIDKNIFDREYLYFKASPQALQTLSALPGVSDVVQRLEFDAKVVGDYDITPFRVMAFDLKHETRLQQNFEMTEGRMFKSGEFGVILPQDFARRHQIKVGDSVRLLAKAANNQVNLIDYTVTGLFNTKSLSAWFDNYVYLDLDVARVLVNDKQTLTRLNVSFKDDADPAKVRSAVQSWMEQNQSKDNPPLEITSWEEGTSTFNDLIGAQQLSYMVVITIIIIMVGASLAFSTMMNILERTKEIATLGALGATPRTVRRILVGESMVLALFAALAGMFAAILLYLITAHYGIPINNKDLSGFLGSSHFFPAFNGAGYVAGLLVPLLVAFFSSFLFARRASRLPLAEALADR